MARKTFFIDRSRPGQGHVGQHYTNDPLRMASSGTSRHLLVPCLAATAQSFAFTSKSLKNEPVKGYATAPRAGDTA